MRSALWCALLCGVAIIAAAQERSVTFEEPSPVAITGFAVGRVDYDRVTRSNTFTAGKVGVSFFKPVGDAYLFAQLTTALEDGASATDIDNLLVSWTPHTANKWSLALGRFDAPIGFERDDEPLNLIPTNSFNFTYARPGKLTGVQVHYTASSRVDVWGVGAEANVGREQQRGGNPSWRGAAVTAFLKMSRHVGLTARYDQLEDSDGLLTGTPQILRSVTVGPMWYFSSAREGIFSNIEHTRFHVPQVALRAAVRADWSSAPFFSDATGALQSSNTKGVLELAYVFGAVMVALYAGFTPQRVAATYAGPEMSMTMPPETTVIVQRPMAMADFAKPEVHTVDTGLLIQDTHVHVPMYGLIAAALGVVVAGLSLSRRWALGLIGLLFAAPWLDFAGMWLTKFASPRFAIVTLAGGWAMGIAYLIVAALAIHQMWLSRERS